MLHLSTERKYKQNKDLQREDQNRLYYKVENLIPTTALKNKNRHKSWIYGYNSSYDMVIISKNGMIGDVVNINGLNIALPPKPDKIYKNSEKTKNQYWQRAEMPKELSRISSIFQWNEMPNSFKNAWVDYIETEFDRREYGFWFYNNGKPV